MFIAVERVLLILLKPNIDFIFMYKLTGQPSIKIFIPVFII
jgi:hypothetical protein